MEIHYFFERRETPEVSDSVVRLVVENGIRREVALFFFVSCKLMFSVLGQGDFHKVGFTRKEINAFAQLVSFLENLKFDGVAVDTRENIKGVIVTKHNLEGA